MVWRSLTLAFLVFLAGMMPAQAKERLVIGITQYPTTLNPIVDAMMAKSYTLAMTRRPMMVYDQNWELVCLLCTEVPTFENGLAKKEKIEAARTGVALTVTIHPDAVWGDGVPVSSEDVVFTWQVGKDPKTGVGSLETYTQILDIDVVDEKTFTMHIDRVSYQYNSLAGFDILPAHIERAKFEGGAEGYRDRTAFDTDTYNPGLYHGPYVITEKVSGSHITSSGYPGLRRASMTTGRE